MIHMNDDAIVIQKEIHDEMRGLEFERHYSSKDVHPFEELEWETRSAVITNEKGETVFEQTNVEVPKKWSQQATNVVVSKYFYGKADTPEREYSVKQLVGRVANTIADWGFEDGYFLSEQHAQVFKEELNWILVNQHAAFNSPVWFNVGIEEKPQCSACFINSVKDDMGSILDLAKTEGMLFKWGSGTGTNLSPIRSSRENLSGGGIASGPVSFMKGYDSFAGVIKSGGRTRRAAKMVVLNVDHPDIVDFVDSKANEEKKAWALIDSGYDGGFNVPGGAYDSIQFQNANHSIRLSDSFMKAVLEDSDWNTRAVTTGEIVETHKARDLMQKIAEAAHLCGDPGLQYDTTINNWHTSKSSGRINASNPCSEYLFLDDTACNLSSVNLMKYYNDGKFDLDGFRHTVRVMTTAKEIIVGNASYPTDSIDKNSHRYRTLGLGFSNLGALLMAKGMPYDSDEGRDYAAAITALMSGTAYEVSAEISRDQGPFEGFPPNREHMLEVMRMHRDSIHKINSRNVSHEMMLAAQDSWDSALKLGEQFGYRNAQISVIAPTGTIAFLMDCDTTGIEPDIALIKYKRLVGGGLLKMVNGTVPLALENLGYSSEEVKEIINYLDKEETIEGAPALKEEHLPVFDCAFKPLNGVRTIHYMGHVRMMAAVQPFISGAISKTVNMPKETTVQEIFDTYIEGWKLGLKAIAIYRDGCKRTQPLNTSIDAEQSEELHKPMRRRLPDERAAITHKFSIAGIHDCYITVGMYEDGTPGEIFLVMSKEGSSISGLMDSLATSISLALQYGVPLKDLVGKFSHSRFEPSGFTQNPDIPYAKSVVDYVFRWLGNRFLNEEAPVTNGSLTAKIEKQTVAVAEKSEKTEKQAFQVEADAPMCSYCGSQMVRNASCYKCLDCGESSGCS